MREPAEVLLRRGGHRDALDARLLGRDDVHHDGGGVDRAAAGDVEPDTLDGHPLLGDGAAGDDLGGVRGAALLAVDETGAADRLLQGGADGPVQLLEGSGERVAGHPDRFDPDTVQFLPPVDHCRGATMAHVLTDGPHRLQGGFHVELGTGQQVAQSGTLGEGVTAQIDSRDHTAILSDRPERPVTRISG
ncbi:hypothetical protein EES46_21185 [Streptomyces sp. ADI98-10]|nr:hypothetical protein EES46_21185 [Streptomyces sp. ADI98-10]